MTYKITIPIILCAIILCSCSQSILPGASQQETQTQTPLSTKIIEPSQTPHPSLTPTSTAIPPEIVEAATQSYLAMLTIQINAQLVSEVAGGIQSGEFIGYDRYFAMLAASAVIEGIHRSIPEITPPHPLLDAWDKASEIHKETKEILRDWFNDEIGTGDVLSMIAPIVVDADEVLVEVEQIMIEEFNFDPDAFTRERERILAALPAVLKSRRSSPIE